MVLVLVLVRLIEIYFIDSKIHPFKVYSLVSFDN